MSVPVLMGTMKILTPTATLVTELVKPAMENTAPSAFSALQTGTSKKTGVSRTVLLGKNLKRNEDRGRDEQMAQRKKEIKNNKEIKALTDSYPKGVRISDEDRAQASYIQTILKFGGLPTRMDIRFNSLVAF